MKEEGMIRSSSSTRRVAFYQPKVDESKRIAFYSPISEGLPLRECSVLPEERALSMDENDTKILDIEKRQEGSNGSFESSSPTASTVSTNNSFGRPAFDLSPFDEDDDDNYSVTSTYTYGTVDTTATSESVHSIISRLQSETDRRRRRLMRRRSARGQSSAKSKPVKPEDPIKGITVEIRE